jgi:hypothetical protein
METAVNPIRTLAVLAALALMSVSAPVLAEQLTLSATLVGTDEVPSNDSPGTGMVDATYDTDTNMLAFSITYSGLTGEATAAHFHGPAAPGENAAPVVPIEGSLASPIAGSATLTDAQEAELLGGQWYFNVHTAAHPGGEIRGQVLQSNISSMASSMLDSSMISSELPSEMSSSELSSVASGLSSISSDLSSILSSVSSDLSSSVDISTSTSVSVSASASVSASVSSP